MNRHMLQFAGTPYGNIMVQAVVSGSTLTITTTDQTREAEYVVTLTDGGRTTGNTATVEVTVVDEGE